MPETTTEGDTVSTIEAPAETTIAPVTRRDVLHRAADLLEEFGWCQNRLVEDASGNSSYDGNLATIIDSRWIRYCARGAVMRAEYEMGLDAELPSISRFNNAPGRTKAQMVARLREAAEDA